MLVRTFRGVEDGSWIWEYFFIERALLGLSSSAFSDVEMFFGERFRKDALDRRTAIFHLFIVWSPHLVFFAFTIPHLFVPSLRYL